MDKLEVFYDLAKRLTGIANLNKALNEEYYLKLFARFGPTLEKDVLEAYAAVMGNANPLADFRATAAFTGNQQLVKQIANIWFLSQYTVVDKGPTFDAGHFEQGAIWPVIKAHPIGFSHEQHGYWTKQPK